MDSDKSELSEIEILKEEHRRQMQLYRDHCDDLLYVNSSLAAEVEHLKDKVKQTDDCCTKLREEKEELVKKLHAKGEPQEGTPQEGTPQDVTPQDDTPHDDTPHDDTPQEEKPQKEKQDVKQLSVTNYEELKDAYEKLQQKYIAETSSLRNVIMELTNPVPTIDCSSELAATASDLRKLNCEMPKVKGKLAEARAQLEAQKSNSNLDLNLKNVEIKTLKKQLSDVQASLQKLVLLTAEAAEVSKLSPTQLHANQALQDKVNKRDSVIEAPENPSPPEEGEENEKENEKEKEEEKEQKPLRKRRKTCD